MRARLLAWWNQVTLPNLIKNVELLDHVVAFHTLLLETWPFCLPRPQRQKTYHESSQIERRNNWVTYLNRERVERWTMTAKFTWLSAEQKRVRSQACPQTMPFRGAFAWAALDQNGRVNVRSPWPRALNLTSSSDWSIRFDPCSHWLTLLTSFLMRSRVIVAVSYPRLATRVEFVYLATIVFPRRCLRLWGKNLI